MIVKLSQVALQDGVRGVGTPTDTGEHLRTAARLLFLRLRRLRNAGRCRCCLVVVVDHGRGHADGGDLSILSII